MRDDPSIKGWSFPGNGWAVFTGVERLAKWRKLAFHAESAVLTRNRYPSDRQAIIGQLSIGAGFRTLLRRACFSVATPHPPGGGEFLSGLDRSFLGVGYDSGDDVCVTFNLEIETPGLVDPSLPKVLGFVVLLGHQGGVPEVLLQSLYLLEKSLAHFGRSIIEDCHGTGEIVDFHRECLSFLAALFLSSLFIWAIISSAELKGPAVRPALMSARSSANRALRILRCVGVYSSSAAGSFGMMLMIPPDTLNSSRSPILMPA